MSHKTNTIYYEQMQESAKECEICKQEYLVAYDLDELKQGIAEENESIESTSRCIGCVEEFGETLWPDQV